VSAAAAHASTPPIVSARGIVNRFGAQQVHDRLDLAVFAGEVVGIAGGSGSGKSVLLRTLIGLHRPNAGQVQIDGKAVEQLAPSEKALLLGVLFQQGALFSSLSVAQNIMLPMREHTRAPVHLQEQAAAMKLALVGLPADSATKSPAELSGGMAKRAALARALALDPRVLFLDEPTADLDALSATGIDELIQQLNQSLHLTVVLVTHDLATLFAVCDRVAVLVEGRLVVDTPPALLHANQPWIRQFLHGPRAQAAQKVREAARKHGNR
jgi:phospholipid/cholesterol/gamma-HCH transport system ATP-binding protein